MAKSNISGAFERARERWHFGALYGCKHMGRGAIGAFLAAGALLEYANRQRFLSDGHLVAFPSLDLLALRAKCSEKTMRRGIDRLEDVGLVRVQHRYNDSNLYFLTIPPEIDTHLLEVEAAIEERRRARKRFRSRTHGEAVEPRENPQSSSLNAANAAVPSVPLYRTDGNGGAPKCPTTSDSTSDFTFIPKRNAGAFSLGGEEEVGEEGREEGASATASPTSSSELARAFAEARQLDGDYAAAVVGKAINHWGRSPQEILTAVEHIKGLGGGADALAYELRTDD